MKRLFKILIVRKGFFLDPKLRLSQRSTLNDPFECLPKTSQVADYYDRVFRLFKEKGHDVTGYEDIGENLRSSSSDSLYQYTPIHDRYGIVSLCQEINST